MMPKEEQTLEVFLMGLFYHVSRGKEGNAWARDVRHKGLHSNFVFSRCVKRGFRL